MSAEKPEGNKLEKTEGGLTKPIRPEDVEFVKLSKTMRVKEVLAEMEKEGIRPLTPEEAHSLMEAMKTGQPLRIEPKDTDIVVGSSEKPKSELGDKKKELPE